MSVDFEAVRKLFPITENFAYFLCSGETPLPKPAAKAAHEMIDAAMNSAILATVLSKPMVEDTRGKVAKLLGCDADEVAFSRNTTEGTLWLAQSMPWEKGDEALVTRGEHGNIVYPFMAQEHNGVKVVFVEQDNRRITPEVIEKGITDRTRVVAISCPQFDNGQRADLKGIAKVCHERDIVLHVDAIQCLGAIRLNVREMDIDCISAGTYKWLLGLSGLGVFYCRKSLLAKLRPVHVGWNSLEEEVSAEFQSDSYDFDPARSARRYEEGAKNLVGIAALNASLSLIEEIGVENIERRVKELTDYLCEQARAKGCEILSPREGDEWSGIVLLRLPKQDPYKLAEDLRGELVMVYGMRNCLIMGVNFYNNQEDIDRLLSSIEAG